MRLIRPRVLLLLISSLAAAHCQAPSGYTLMYQDDFSGPHVNENDWSYRIDHRQVGTWLNGYDRKENVSEHDGELHIAVRQDVIDGKPELTGGGLISTHQFGYGYYECLSRPFMSGKGVHTAFWLAGGVTPNNDILEIDSYEIDSGTFMGTNNLYLHLNTPDKSEAAWPLRSSEPWSFRKDGWYFDAFEWTPDGINFYDNGVLHAHVDYRDFPAQQKVYLTGLNGIAEADSSKQPGESVFKYFRYYTKDYPDRNILPNGDFEYNQTAGPNVKPIAWVLTGDTNSVQVIESADPAHGKFALHLGDDHHGFKTQVAQKLEFIMDGNYRLTGMYRTTGKQVDGVVRVSSANEHSFSTRLQSAAEWTPFNMPVSVSGHTVNITLSASGTGGEAAEFDNIQFFKPSSETSAPNPRPYTFWSVPIWKTAQSRPIHFTGDGSFIMLDRNVGNGDAVTVTLSIKPDVLEDALPIARWDETGSSGWAISLTRNGSISFSVGSRNSHNTLTGSKAYTPKKFQRITAVFDHGTASLFVDGKKVASRQLKGVTTDGNISIGKLGNTGNDFAAVGEVALSTGLRASSAARFRGVVSDVQIYNRALRPDEINKLPIEPQARESTWIKP